MTEFKCDTCKDNGVLFVMQGSVKTARPCQDCDMAKPWNEKVRHWLEQYGREYGRGLVGAYDESDEQLRKRIEERLEERGADSEEALDPFGPPDVEPGFSRGFVKHQDPEKFAEEVVEAVLGNLAAAGLMDRSPTVEGVVKGRTIEITVKIQTLDPPHAFFNEVLGEPYQEGD